MKKAPKRNPRKVPINDPVDFAQQFLNVELWPLQGEILRAILTNRRIAVRSCHSSGKSFLSAVIAIFWLLRYKDAKVIVTGPSFLQVRTVLFGEIHRLLRGMKYQIAADQNQVEIRLSPQNFILGLSSDSPERLQGHHGGHLLVICDEAPGIDQELWQGLESLLASGDTKLLAIGNPTQSGGFFYDVFHRDSNAWRTFAISWRDTPNFTGIDSIEDLFALSDAELDNNPWPMLLGRRWVADAYARWFNGSEENSPLWQSRVMGEFPSQSSNALISLPWLEAAKRFPVDTGGKIIIGIDVGGPGADESVACVQCGGAVLDIRAWNQPDPRGEIIALLNRHRSRLKSVRIDSAGLGYGIALSLQDDHDLPIEFVNVGTASTDSERFLNSRAELFWSLRERLKNGEVAGLTDPLTIAQLSSLTYELTPKGQIKIESKDDMRRRGIKSPDRGDAVMLALGEPGGDQFKRFMTQVKGWEEAAQEARARPPRPEGTAPPNRWAADPLDWNAQRMVRPSRWAKSCQHCGEEIGDNVPYSNAPIGRSTDSCYAHVACAQKAMAGMCEHCAAA